MSQNEKIFGLHSVESLLSTTPEKVVQLFLQKSRKDSKLNQIESLASKAVFVIS